MFTVQIHRRQIYIFYSQFLRWPWKGKGNFCREIKSLCQQICHWQQKWLTCVNMHNRTIQCMQGNEPYLVGSWGRKKNACFSKHTVSSISDPFLYCMFCCWIKQITEWLIQCVTHRLFPPRNIHLLINFWILLPWKWPWGRHNYEYRVESVPINLLVQQNLIQGSYVTSY